MKNEHADKMVEFTQEAKNINDKLNALNEQFVGLKHDCELVRLRYEESKKEYDSSVEKVNVFIAKIAENKNEMFVAVKKRNAANISCIIDIQKLIEEHSKDCTDFMCMLANHDVNSPVLPN